MIGGIEDNVYFSLDANWCTAIAAYLCCGRLCRDSRLHLDEYDYCYCQILHWLLKRRYGLDSGTRAGREPILWCILYTLFDGVCVKGR